MAKITGIHSGGRIGEIMDHGSSTLPAYTLACDGTAVSRTTYAALFAVIGTSYGVGDGSTTFNLPNGKALFKRGAGAQTVGGVALTATHGATQGDQVQGHYHRVSNQWLNGRTTTAGGGNANYGETVSSSTLDSLGAITDGTNGTPRTGTETRPANLGVTYAIVYV